MKLFHAAALVAALTAVACGQAKTEKNDVKTISTDLPDTGKLGPTRMYWVDGASILRGTCGDKQFVIKSNCQNNVEVMAYGAFQVKLDNGLKANVDSLSAQVEEIEGAIAVVEHDIRVTSDALDAYEVKLGQATAELNETKAELALVTTWIAEYRAQLAAIKAKLKQMRDSDLKAQSEQMAGELQLLLDGARDLCSKIAGMTAKVEYYASVVVALEIDLRSLSTRLSNLEKDYTETSRDLQKACEELSKYNATIAMLTDSAGINYRVHADTPWFQVARRFVKRFDAIFTEGASKK